jgi:ribonuclease HI
MAGIIRRHTGDYVGMFATALEAACGTRAEFHAVNTALSILVRTDGAEHVVIRSDADAVVGSFNNTRHESWMHPYGVTTAGLAGAFEYCSIESIDRLLNETADTACDMLRWADHDQYVNLDGEFPYTLEDLELEQSGRL